MQKPGELVPVCREIDARAETPLSALSKIRRGGYAFLLESAQSNRQADGYSFIGTEPYRVLTTRQSDQRGALETIAAALSRYKMAAVEGLPDFCGGAVGYLGYEAVRRIEELPSPEADPLSLPEAVFMLVDSFLVFDHAKNKIKIVALARPDVDNAYRKATDKIDELAARLKKAAAPHPTPSQQESSGTAEVVSNLTRAEFEANVAKAREYIVQGEAIQIVLSQRLSRPTTARPLDIYRALRRINPSPYMFFLDCNGFQVIGASPEILVRAIDGKVTTRPLAGTRPRGKTPADDKRLETELRADEKERAEHVMLVDLGRNDIGRVSLPGTVRVSELMDVEKYSHVMHLVTNVDGKIRPELAPVDALAACFPAGTVSGAPKIRAMQVIAELEPDQRGPYAGCVGYFSFSGAMDTAITIRTIVLVDGTAHVQAGAGIVYDSVPEREYEETMNKARALLKAIEQAEIDEA
jgi:anthranilate synthase component 1